ncbi:uncharacterized protein LOC128995581 [Macrosteles quadrilineatus]|uniref:uncharacterized protein LOC128995581 n=1 Tax=Macrosteles quadrilineatus TaxID=74068 RepID=UPI0023E251A2|nr:uncharacterized protein LOC128995581 [Macrosteles quadrilineatus]
MVSGSGNDIESNQGPSDLKTPPKEAGRRLAAMSLDMQPCKATMQPGNRRGATTTACCRRQEFFFDLLEDGRIKNQNSPVLQNTKLGWIVGGKVHHQKSSTETSCHLTTLESLDKNIQAFWKIEEEPIKKATMTSENKLCEEMYDNSVQRGDDGRYTVKMPLKQDPSSLGDSKELAIKRFYQVERRLKNNSELQKQYKSFMHEYEELGHMEKVTANETDKPVYYLSHHPVIKEASSTTKLRVVFDASAKTTTGISLNDSLMVGPTLQDDLFSILLRFRIHTYVLTADIEKMYRQIWIHPSQRDMLRILWREDNSKPVLIYRLNTVTYGTACAPYLAIKTIQQLAQDERSQYPQASNVVMKDFYVDDVLTGTDDINEARVLRDQLVGMLKCGGFNLRKFNSNSNALLAELPDDIVERKAHKLPNSNDSTIKTLGIFWDAESDKIKYKYMLSTDNKAASTSVTKRTVLSDIAKLFDPLGIISPIIINAKILMQDLWKQNMKWDDVLPEQLHKRLLQFKQDLTLLSNFNVSRCVRMIQTEGTFELHGFSDASEKAYGAAIYLRHELSDGTAKTTLLCSKSRVTPLKTQSLPRLELWGALLLTELMSNVKTALINKHIERVTYWTDSTIVLSWLNAEAACWKTFIANRIAKIQDLSDYKDWRHVPSQDNPADLVSRGLTVDEIIRSDLWNSGPYWLSLEPCNWPITSIQLTFQKEESPQFLLQ